MAVRAEVTGRRTYRLGRAATLTLLVCLTAWAAWVVVFATWRPWEGSRPRLDGVGGWEALTDPAPSSLGGARVALLPSPTPAAVADRRLVIGFLGAGCTTSPWRVTERYSSASITVAVDPDPRGCRGGDEGDQLRAFQVELDEGPSGRPVTVTCVASELCDRLSRG